MGNLSKEEKRAMLKAWKAGQKRNHILKKKDVKKLFDYLESELEKSPCDNTLKHTEKWVVENYKKRLQRLCRRFVIWVASVTVR